jgi:hypothetical protein
MNRSAWWIALFGIAIVAAASAGIYFAKHNRAPARVAVAPAAPVNVESEVREPAPEPAPYGSFTPSPGTSLAPGHLQGGVFHTSLVETPAANPDDQTSVRKDPSGGAASAQNAAAEAKRPAPPAPTTTPGAKAAATIVQNADGHPAAAAAKKSASSNLRPGPGIALPASSQPRGTKGLQQSAAQGSGLGLDTMARTAKSRATDATGNVAAAPTAAARQYGLGLSARLRKKPAANVALPNDLAPGLAAATIKTKPKSSNPNASNAAGTTAQGGLDMAPSEPNPNTSDLGYYLSPYDGRSTYAQAAPGDAQAGVQSFGPPSTDPVRPLTLIPQWTAVAQAPYPANYPVYPPGIGYQPTERPKNSIRPLVLVPQFSLPPGYGPQGSPPWQPVAPYSGSQAAGTSSGNAPIGAPSSQAPGPSLRVYGVP